MLSPEEIASIRKGDVLQYGHLRYLVSVVSEDNFICYPMNEHQLKDGIHIWNAQQFAKYEWEILLKTEDTYPHENL